MEFGTLRQTIGRSSLTSERRLRALISNAPLIVFALDRRGVFTLAEGHSLALLGHNPDQLVGRSAEEVYGGHPEVLRQIAQAMAGEHIEAVVELAGHMFDAWYLPIHDDHDVVAGVIGVAVDITARYQAEQELRRQRDFAEQVMEMLGQGLTVTNAQRRLTYVNPAFARMVGKPAAELIGKHTHEVLSIEEQTKLDQAHAARLSGMGTTYESQLRSADGRDISVLITGTPLYEQGVFTGSIAAVVDLTQQKALEGALQTANRQLTAQVAALEARTQAMTLLNELGERLQNVDVEAGGVVALAARYLPLLFPDHAGVLYLLAPGDLAEPMVAWGDLRGLGDGSHQIQLQVQGEALGWLALSMEAGPPVEDGAVALWLRDAQAAAHQIALALANLRLRETLRRQAMCDDLTGLLNRRALMTAFERELARSLQEGTPLCIVLGDIDHFKHVNDSCGHGAGDAVIREVAELFRHFAGPGGLACRYGGEELVMVLPAVDLAGGMARAEALREATAELRPHHDGNIVGAITISLGVAAFPHNGASVEALLRAADNALYAGKRGGRNRVVAADLDVAAPTDR